MVQIVSSVEGEAENVDDDVVADGDGRYSKQAGANHLASTSLWPGKCQARRLVPAVQDLALPAARRRWPALARGQACQLQPLVPPKGAQGVGHQQQLEGDEAADHPKAHRAHQEQERKSNDRDPAKASGDSADVRPAVHVAVVFAVANGGDLEDPVVDGGGGQPEQRTDACQRLADANQRRRRRRPRRCTTQSCVSL